MNRLIGLSMLALLTATAACGSTPGPAGLPGEGDAIRISYIRFNPAQGSDLRQPTYYYFTSESWTRENGTWYDTYGASSKEPFCKMFRHPVIRENIPDEEMKTFLGSLMKLRYDTFPHRRPESISLEMLKAVRNSQDKRKMATCRIISVQRGRYRKAVILKDMLDPEGRVMDPDPPTRFMKCERMILAKAAAAIQIRKGDGAAPRIERR